MAWNPCIETKGVLAELYDKTSKRCGEPRRETISSKSFGACALGQFVNDAVHKHKTGGGGVGALG